MGYRRTTRLAPRMLALVLSLLLMLAALPVSAGATPPDADVATAPASSEIGFARARLSSALGGVHALAADDDIPGISVVSPYSGAIDLLHDDYMDVLQVVVAPGQIFTAEITMSSGEWVGAALLPPGSTDALYDPVDAFSVHIANTTDRISRYSKNGGTYYLALFAVDADGTQATLGDGYLNYTVSFQSAAPGDYSDVGTARALAGSQTDVLDWRNDVNDGYYVDLVAGDQIRLVSNPTQDLDLNLWGPDPTSIWGSELFAQYDWGTGTDEITYLVPPGGDGRYYVEVFASVFSGTYTLTSSITRPNVPRVSGENRYLTSTASSKSTWASSDAVVLATGLDPADALAASGVAGVLDAPVILVPSYDKITSLLAVYWEIERLDCTDAYIVGGDAAVDPRIELDLEDLGCNVIRLSGANRYLTALDVAEEMASMTPTDTAFVVRGDDYADALAVSPYAFSQGAPVLLTKPGELYAATAGFIEAHDITNVVVAGGEVAVSSAVVAQLEALNGGATNVVRRSGATRYATAKAVADYAIDDMGWGSWDFIGTATGQSFPDALSGGAVCGRRGGALLLTKSLSLREEVADSVADNDPEMVMIFGGTAAVSSGVATGIQNLMP